MRQSTIILLGVILLALVIRVIALIATPQGLMIDEALHLYNGYSIAVTGHDPYDFSFPIHFFGFGWGSDTVIVYFCALLFHFFGLVPLIVLRCIPLLAHLLLVIYTYRLAKLLFNERVGLISAALLAISPWSIALSHVLFDAAVLPFFLVVGMYSFIRWVREPNNAKAALSAAFWWAIACYTYALSFIWIPILIALVTLCLGEWRSIVRRSLWFVIPFAILTAPITLYYLQNQFHIWSSLTTLGVISLPHTVTTRFSMATIWRLVPWWSAPLFMGAIYVLHYSPWFLFWNATLAYMLPHNGIILIALAPFLVIGVVTLIKNIRNNKTHRFLLAWLLLAAVPVSFTYDFVPHPLRFISAMPVFEIIIAIGACSLWDRYRNTYSRTTIATMAGLCALVASIQLSYGIMAYRNTSYRVFHGESAELARFITEQSKQKSVVVFPDTDEYVTLLFSYLYFSHVDPSVIQLLPLLSPTNDVKLGTIDFWMDIKNIPALQSGILYITSPATTNLNALSIVKEFKDPNGNILFVAGEKK